MGSFGEKLRREREMRSISLDEIATATKIGTRSLKALEDENFSILPGGIFNKGFVRAYARFLGLNEDEAVADYLVAMKEQPVSVKTIAAQSAMAKANRLAAQQARESSHAAGILRAGVLLVVAAVIAFGGYQAYLHGYFRALKRPGLHWQMKQQAQVTPPESTASQPIKAAQSTPDTQVIAASPTPSGAQPSPAPPVIPALKAMPSAAITLPAEFTVSIKTSERSWLSIAADGKRAVQRTFLPNEEQSITAKTKVRITIGNPSGTELSLNGRSLAISGDLTRPRTVIVDAGGLSTE